MLLTTMASIRVVGYAPVEPGAYRKVHPGFGEARRESLVLAG
jgi:hypothetical protein